MRDTTRCFRSEARGGVRNERSERTHPGTDGKGESDQGEKLLRREDVIRRRRERVIVRAGFRRLAMRVLVLAAVVWIVFTYGFLITQAHGQGMFPAVKDGDLCIVFRRQAQALFGEKLVKDDIILYRMNGQQYAGRVAAVAGDVIALSEGGGVTVNGVSQGGEILYSTYVRGELDYPYQVPEGCVYVLGDHRTDTTDSRDLGPIPLDSVEGKVITILRRRGL